MVTWWWYICNGQSGSFPQQIQHSRLKRKTMTSRKFAQGCFLRFILLFLRNCHLQPDDGWVYHDSRSSADTMTEAQLITGCIYVPNIIQSMKTVLHTLNFCDFSKQITSNYGTNICTKYYKCTFVMTTTLLNIDYKYILLVLKIFHQMCNGSSTRSHQRHINDYFRIYRLAHPDYHGLLFGAYRSRL